MYFVVCDLNMFILFSYFIFFFTWIISFQKCNMLVFSRKETTITVILYKRNSALKRFSRISFVEYKKQLLYLVLYSALWLWCLQVSFLLFFFFKNKKCFIYLFFHDLHLPGLSYVKLLLLEFHFAVNIYSSEVKF